MARKQSKEPEEVTQADLLPVMNIMFLLIPALLMAMEFAQMAAITVVPPTHGADADTNSPPKKEGLDLAVMVARDGIEVRAAGEPIGARIPRLGDGASQDAYDFAALAARIAPLKAMHPEEATVYVWAEGDVDLQALIGTFDALRGPDCEMSKGTGEGCLFWHPVLRPA